MAVFAVQYSYTDRTADRDLHRPAHRAYLRELFADGILLAAGAWAAQEQPGALLIFRAGSADEVADRIRLDPFVTTGVVRAADIREWSQTMGPWS